MGLLDVLAEGGGLHLLPPIKNLPPAMQQSFQDGSSPPLEVVKCYSDLMTKNQLKKSRQEGSLVWELANLYTAKASGQYDQ